MIILIKAIATILLSLLWDTVHIMSFNSHNPDGWELLAPFYRWGN